jgi:hypothetical protein
VHQGAMQLNGLIDTWADRAVNQNNFAHLQTGDHRKPYTNQRENHMTFLKNFKSEILKLTFQVVPLQIQLN